MGPIVVGTGNPHKVEELRAILGPLGIELLSLADARDSGPEPDEPGSTFEENAALKALAYADRTGRLCLADDSGLEVDALAGAPGVISARYHSEGRDTDLPRPDRDRLNNERLLNELEGVPPARRTARFVCAMALAGGTGVPPVPRDPVTPLLQRRRRNLPHWQRGGSTYFITFRVLRGELTPEDRQITLNACCHWHGKRAEIHLVVVMPDHVHILLTPLRRPDGTWHSLSEILHSIKGFSSHRILEARGTPGPLWQDESFDRIVRDEDEFYEKWAYILLNPVRKGLVKSPGEYPFTASPTRREFLAAVAEGRVTDADRHRRDACATTPTILASVRATFEGRIGLPGQVPRGSNGFGYDPLFLVAPDFTRTSAELSPDEKNRLSHRGNAARAMAAAISELLRSGA